MTFKFKPLQHVQIPMLECKGRITRCILYAGAIGYNVEYPMHGKMENREFYEDELEYQEEA